MTRDEVVVDLVPPRDAACCFDTRRPQLLVVRGPRPSVDLLGRAFESLALGAQSELAEQGHAPASTSTAGLAAGVEARRIPDGTCRCSREREAELGRHRAILRPSALGEALMVIGVDEQRDGYTISGSHYLEHSNHYKVVLAS